MIAHEPDRLARVALSRLTEPGDLRLLSLVSELGAVTVYDHLHTDGDLDGAARDLAVRLSSVDPADDLARATRAGIRFVTPADDEWPVQLDDLADAGALQERGGVPIGLWVRGPQSLRDLASAVAVVGSRSATSYGGEVANEIAARCGSAGLPVVSGGAFGIDQSGHRGAIGVGAPTVAVLACGVDRVYPAAHAALFAHIGRTGALVSEAAPGWAPTRIRFLARNRLIAGLCRGTVIVEAAVRSGALNTANWTDRLSRVLMGVPGPVTSAPSQGVHQLLRRGGAMLVTCGDEVLEMVGASGSHVVIDERGPGRSRDELSVRQQQVLDAVPVAVGARSDSIARAAGIGLVEVRKTLGRLAGGGLVEQTADGWRLGEGGRA
jgi:DNA processing protein